MQENEDFSTKKKAKERTIIACNLPPNVQITRILR